ncbi:MAG: hypothetical protein P4L71_10770 [Acetobacteraceae bacterium]|nr:hypothetical protein [Acetobacteraceae bacterium]
MVIAGAQRRRWHIRRLPTQDAGIRLIDVVLTVICAAAAGA